MNPETFPRHSAECYLTRKDKLDTIGGDAVLLTDELAAATAWNRLSELMVEMGSPDAARLPKFNDLLLAIVKATAAGWSLQGEHSARTP